MSDVSPLKRKTNGERVGRPPIADLERFARRYCRLLEHQLRGTFGAASTVRFETVETRKFSSLEPTPEAAVIAVAVSTDGAFSGFATIDNVLAARIIETALGVPDIDPSPPERPMTSVDEALARPFVDDAFSCFGAAIEAEWGPTIASGLLFERFVASSSALLEIEAGSDMLDFTIAVALRPDAAPTRFGMTFSLGGLERLKAVYDAPEEAPPPAVNRDPVWSRAMRRAAAGAEMKTVAVLRRVRMNLGEASEMRPGDIIPLSLDGGMNVEIALTGEDAPVICYGALGAADDRRAVKVDVAPAPDLVRDVQTVLRGGV